MAGPTMGAVELAAPGGIDALTPAPVAIPDTEPGWVRLRVKAFGVNESEVTSRKGRSGSDFTFPRILGIEAVGIVDAVAPHSALRPGQKAATMMGGMGRSIDGSYAHYTLVREQNVIPFESDLPWEVLGALPEMMQTAYGSLTTGLDLRPGQTLLIRGGTSTVGLTAAALARRLGATVISTTRNPAHLSVVEQAGADHPVLDDRTLADTVRAIAPRGVEAALELVGATALADTLALVRPGGTVCFTGALAGGWTIADFSPFSIPTGVRLTSYAGQATDLPAEVFASQLAAIEDGSLPVILAATYHGLEQVGQAQQGLETGVRPGKHVVVLD